MDIVTLPFETFFFNYRKHRNYTLSFKTYLFQHYVQYLSIFSILSNFVWDY